MAQVGRTGLLQLLRGTREPRELGRVPGPIAGAVVANSSSPEPATPPTVDPDACAGSTMATSTARAPSLSCSSLRRQSSEIRTGCANERPSGSGEGVASNHDPYSDPATLYSRFMVSSWPTRSGLTITAVTFNLRYLLFNYRPTGAYLLVRQIQIPRCGRACTRRLRR